MVRKIIINIKIFGIIRAIAVMRVVTSIHLIKPAKWYLGKNGLNIPLINVWPRIR